ncbi:MAG: CPBP family intramembrane glutamic endopeptidase [Chitinophagaceae bacterium]
MATKLKYQLPGVQFAVFFGLAVGMFLLNVVITKTFFGNIAGIFSSEKTVSPALLTEFKWAQFAGTILSFVAPPILYGLWADERPLRYVGMKREVRIIPIIIAALLLICVQPLAMMLGELNQQVNFGTAHTMIKSTEELYERILTKFMVMDSPADLLINMVIVALLPAIGEELFFRGALQNILEKWTQRPVIAIGIASFLFALLHGTFFKFLPIFVLGITLGVLFYVTRNLWYSIFFHFLNNALALVASYYAQRNEFMKRLADDDLKLNWSIALISLALTVALFYFLRKRIPFQPLEKTWTSNSPEHYNTSR